MSEPVDREALEELAVLYVLGELRPDEAAAFKRRLRDDAALAAAVSRLRGTLDLLPFGALREPPPELRVRVLGASARRDAAPRRPRRIVWSRFIAAAAAALALAFGVDAWRARRELSLQHDLAMALLEPNVVHTFALAGAGGAVARVALDLDAKRGAVVARGLHPLPPGQVYRLWAQVGDRSVWCGDFEAHPEGAALAQFRVPIESYTAPIVRLFVTAEAARPPTTPAGPEVMAGA